VSNAGVAIRVDGKYFIDPSASGQTSLNDAGWITASIHRADDADSVKDIQRTIYVCFAGDLFNRGQ